MPKDKLVVVQGFDDAIIVEKDGILLISKKDDEQKLRTIVDEVKKQKGDSFV